VSEPTARTDAPTAAPIEAVALDKRYRSGDGSEIQVLAGVDLRVESGEAIAVTGASGAGKSTLLHLLGALDRPTSGEVRVGGRAVSNMDEQALAAVRNRHVGFVFQFHHLLREFTALENVMIPALVGGDPVAEAETRARRLLEAVGLDHRLTHKPWQLSGGEQQRVAVARALVNDPLVLLADEPSGNLDHHSSRRLHDLLFELRRRGGPEREVGGAGTSRSGVHRRGALAMVLVTHNLELAARADRLLHLEDGRLQPRTHG
jgi:lipoprotein-releasing system ATP-binding protein